MNGEIPIQTTEYEAAYQAGIHSVTQILPDTTPEGEPALLLHHRDFQIASMEPFLASPQRRRTNALLSSVGSFVAYVNEYKDAGSRLFAEKAGLHIVGILDYHGANTPPSWCENRVTLRLSFSQEWKTWSGKSGQAMSQVQFAEFLEDHYADIIEPDGATVLEAASLLEAKKSVRFKSGVSLQSGAAQLVYEEAIEGKGKGEIVIPTAFTLLLPVYEYGEVIRVPARLRYRIKDDALTFTYLLNQPHKITEAAFVEVLSQVEAGTGISAYLGVP